jgi:hypothetical protein
VTVTAIDLRGRLATDAGLLDDYLRGQAAPVIAPAALAS